VAGKPKSAEEKCRPKLVEIRLVIRTDMSMEELRRKSSWEAVLVASTGWTTDRDRIILESLAMRRLRWLDRKYDIPRD